MKFRTERFAGDVNGEIQEEIILDDVACYGE